MAKPEIRSARLDHHRTRTFDLRSKSWLPLFSVPESVREEALQRAQQIVERTANQDDYLIQAQRQTEIYLFDREQHPETALRQSVVDQLNERPYCRAVLTRKRSLENYLHPSAIAAACGVWIDITDETPVSEAVAQARPEWQAVWPTLSHRARQRQIYRMKRLLNTEAVRHMTAELLAERDPAGEVIGWFREIGRLIELATS